MRSKAILQVRLQPEDREHIESARAIVAEFIYYRVAGMYGADAAGVAVDG